MASSQLRQTFTRSTCFQLTKQTSKFYIYAVLTKMLVHLLDIWEKMFNYYIFLNEQNFFFFLIQPVN